MWPMSARASSSSSTSRQRTMRRPAISSGTCARSFSPTPSSKTTTSRSDDPWFGLPSGRRLMKAAIIVFPGINRDRDMAQALKRFTGQAPQMVWQTETELPPHVDLVVLPGGFSYGDYLRCGAIAARAPIMAAVRQAARRGVKVLGVCNGFQILIEAGLLPGALMRNASLHFVCREIKLEVVNAETDFSRAYAKGQIIRCPVAHHDGNYFADTETLAAIEGNGQVVFRY